MHLCQIFLYLLLILRQMFFVQGNDRPIIGILSQELSTTTSEFYGNHSSYIAASYVKYIEGAGGRVVPIWINETEDYYKELAASVNGILFPGGATYFDKPDGYAEAGAILYQLAVYFNDHGDYFPVWGTCLGFELLTYLAAGQKELRCDCSAENIALPLEFKEDFKQSKLFATAKESLLSILTSQNITANFHSFCVTQQNFTEFGLEEDWHVLSLSHDLDGIEFISTVESRSYPFYGTQFHPEKNGYEWKSTKDIPHTLDAVIMMQYFANFFVNEARKNSHSFQSSAAEEEEIIYRYTPQYTGDHLAFEQCYFFDRSNNAMFSKSKMLLIMLAFFILSVI